MFFRQQHLHFTGIGGIGMSGIAEVLLNLGYEISGSDAKLTPITDRLTKLGARVCEGHDAANVGTAKALVVSSAIDPHNPEVQEAKRLQIPIIARGELLAELMRLKYGIAVGGSHGKTTTTSMIAAILSHAGMDPTVVVGGRVAAMGGSNARVGKSDFLVVESDESDGSFVKLAPILAVVTNIDREHLDHYADIDAIRLAFAQFINKVPFYGAAILCLDDENIQQVLPFINRRTITYGQNPQAAYGVADYSCGHFSSEFAVRFNSQELGHFRLNVPGFHNVLNATAALAVARWLEIGVEIVRDALENYSGVERRFQKRGEAKGITVIDDYGHHPTEIRATLAAARECHFARVIALFQPHRYTRTQALLDDFGKAFHQADFVFVLDVYAASEQPIEGVSGERVAERIRAFGHRSAEYAGSIDNAVQAALGVAEADDVVITLGAGNVWQAGDKLLDRLREGR